MELLVIAILLTVAAAELQCSTDCVESVTAEDDQINVKCQLTYSGDKPTLTWHNEQDGPELEEIASQTEEVSGTVVRDFPKKADAPGVAPLFCKATIPEVADVWCETQQCKTLYSVRNVVTLPEYYASPGEKITCKADGNPAPSFEWQWTREEGDGQWMDVPDAKTEEIDAELKNGTSIQLRCVAKNNVKDDEKTAHSPAVTVSKYGAYIRTAIIVGVVVGVALLGGTAGVIYKVKN